MTDRWRGQAHYKESRGKALILSKPDTAGQKLLPWLPASDDWVGGASGAGAQPHRALRYQRAFPLLLLVRRHREGNVLVHSLPTRYFLGLVKESRKQRRSSSSLGTSCHSLRHRWIEISAHPSQETTQIPKDDCSPCSRKPDCP